MNFRRMQMPLFLSLLSFAQATGYVGRDRSAVYYLDVVELQGKIEGSFQFVYTSADNVPKIKTNTFNVHGTMTGQQFSLQVGQSIWSGEKSGNRISLNLPLNSGGYSILVLSTSSPNEYNKLVSDFKNEVQKYAKNIQSQIDASRLAKYRQKDFDNTLDELKQYINSFEDIRSSYNKSKNEITRGIEELKSDNAKIINSLKKTLDCSDLAYVKDVDLSYLKNTTYSYLKNTTIKPILNGLEGLKSLSDNLNNLQSQLNLRFVTLGKSGQTIANKKLFDDMRSSSTNLLVRLTQFRSIANQEIKVFEAQALKIVNDAESAVGAAKCTNS